MRPKPKPPSKADVDTSMAQEMLKRLGVDYRLGGKGDLLYQSLIALWRELKRPPTRMEMINRSGFTEGSYDHHIRDLVRKGRVLRRRGAWIPVIDE